MRFFSPLVSFKTFSGFLQLECMYQAIIVVAVAVLYLSRLEGLWGFWNYSLVSVIDFGKFSSIISSSISSALFCLLSNTHVTHDTVPHFLFLEALFWLSFSGLPFGSFSWPTFKPSDSFLGYIYLLMSTLKALFISVTVYFVFYHF